ncbi:probable histone-lysine N-methyltransferase CG1716 isoform X2 [Wyeomyia smithii]|uniref:probable histone-lysine N-methyltransferase CG1716 isoform X2 n=1 Tax=Wyeomyia smithii TaxID=174621 RepID=UPI002467CA01|nr:probable histone-lysine N-methyltransferase CG1716 isoform X2 [Wyeomyia smithii]
MGRTTRTSAAGKTCTTPPKDNDGGETSPPVPSAVRSDAVPAEVEASSVDTLSASSSNLRPSVLLEKLPVDNINPPLTPVVKKLRVKSQTSPVPRATRSQKRNSPTSADDEEIIELIEILDDDSKSRESSNVEPSAEDQPFVAKLDEDFDEITCTVIHKSSPETTDKSKQEESTGETSMVVDATKQSSPSNERPLHVLIDKMDIKNVQRKTDKKIEEDDATSSVSSGLQVSHEGEGDKSPKTEVIGTRKSKRQVKVTNKYRDFVVDAPLPSSHVPYSDIKLARSNVGGKKSHTKETEMFFSSDDFSPDSPPIVVQTPKKTYSNKKGSNSDSTRVEPEEIQKRRMTRSTTPVSFRGRKKKETSAANPTVLLQPDDETVEFPGPNDKTDSTLTLNIDSSYFSDEDIFGYDGTPSPDEFCGWPDDDFKDPSAGSSFSTLSSFSLYAPDSSHLSTTSHGMEMDYSEGKSETKVKRRGRPPKQSQTKLITPVAETNTRPAGSTFIKRSYKPMPPRPTTPGLESSFQSIVKIKEQKLTVEPIEVIQPVSIEHPDTSKQLSTAGIEDVLEDAIEIVLQAEEIIIDNDAPLLEPAIIPKPPRSRRRIRGGRRPSPTSGPPRRGRSRIEGDLNTDEDSSQSVISVIIQDSDLVSATEADQPILAVETAPLPIVEEEIQKTVIPIAEESSSVSFDVVEKSLKKNSKKSKSKDDCKRDISHEERKSDNKPQSPIPQPKTSVSTTPQKDSKDFSGSTSKTPDSGEIIVLDSKDIIPKTTVVIDSTRESKEDLSRKDSHKESKKSSKDSKHHRRPSSSKDSRKHHKDRYYKDSKDRESSRKDRDSSKSSKDRDKERHRRRSSDGRKDKRSDIIESDKKRSDSKDLGISVKKAEPDKKRTESVIECKPVGTIEKHEKQPAIVPSVPKLSEKPKKCFDSELQAMDSTSVTKHKSGDDSKRSKEHDKSRKSDKYKHRSESEMRKKMPVTELKVSHMESKEKSRSTDSSPVPLKQSDSESRKRAVPELRLPNKESKEKSRSTDSSPVPSKHGNSSSSSKKSSKEFSGSVRKESHSSSSSKARKSLSGSIKDEKLKDDCSAKKEKTKYKISTQEETQQEDTKAMMTAVAPIEVIPPAEVQPVKEEVTVEQELSTMSTLQEAALPDTPRIATKASRKMYQGEDEIQQIGAPQECLQPKIEPPVDVVKQEENQNELTTVKLEQEETTVQQISEAFDSSVQISGPRPEVALKEFENISISDEKPVMEMAAVPKLVQEDKPPPPATGDDSIPSQDTTNTSIALSPSQELSNEDSNSNSTNSSMLDASKEPKTETADDGSIRRSSRIKTISSQKQRTSGHGLVKDKDKFLKKTTISVGIDSKVLKDAITGNFNVISASDGASIENSAAAGENDPSVTNIELSEEYLRDMEEKLSRFETIRENMYHCDKVISKEAKKMMCDCFLTGEDIDRGELGCGEDCLNKLLMIECGPRCVVGDRCTNRRFQKQEYSNCQVFRTEKKGFGIQANTPIVPGEFIMEYVGEVLNSAQFDERAELYSKEKNKHYYFMALRCDAIIDATTKGNISRFINHSCDPNAETQKWTVNGELRIGFFSTKYIMPGEEITFDYQFQRYGRRAQKCYCEAENCTGWIGGDPGSDGESEYEEEEVEESEEEDTQTAETAVVSTDTALENLKLEGPKGADGTPLPTVEGDSQVVKPDESIVAIKPPEPKQRKVRKRVERPKKRRPQIHEDPDLEKEINQLLKTGLKNQAQTLKLSRMMVRAKDIKSRSRLLTILQSGELPCRRLFLDYHGLRLLYGWICESTESIDDLKFRIQILDTLDRLPIPNKTMLKDSKIMQTIEKWAKIEKSKEKEKEEEKEKERETSSTSSPSDSNGAGSDSNTSSADAKKQDIVGSVEVLKNMPELLKLADLGKLKEIISSTCVEKEADKEKPSSVITETAPSAVSLMDSIEIPEPEDENAPEEKRLGTQIRILSCKLLISWVNLKEVFRIPKKERIEQMKEHEREADLRYKALGLGDDDDKNSSYRQASSRYFDRTRELKRRKSVDEASFYKMKRALASTASPMPKMDNLSKQQRRQLFEMKVAHEEAERRNKELWLQHENNCLKFGLNPHMTAPHDVPAKMNPATGEYFSADDRLLPTPPSHMYFKVLPPPMSTNPEDYELPPMDLPPLWKFAIDDRGRLYYYHVKDRVPQWEPPKKDNHGLRDEDISMSSDSSTTDTDDSEEEYLHMQLEQLMKRKKKQQSSFNLDDVLAKPDDMNDDLSKTIKDLEASDSSPQSSSKIDKALGETIDKTAEELLQHRKRKHSNKLVQERVISPRTEEDKLYGQMEMKRYKETKEKLRRRKEEAKRLRARSMLDKSLASDSPFSGSFSTDPLDKSAAESSLIDDDLVVSHKIVDDKCIVDELDILTKKKKISPYEEWQKVKQRLGKKRAAKMGESSTFSGSSASSSGTSSLPGASSSKIGKRKKTDKLDLNSEEAKKIKEKFRGEIAGVIVQHLGAYRKDSCQTGRITNTEDFKHLARKLTHFVLVKELKHCDNTVNELEVTDSVRTKAREFIKKYMAKHGTVYVRGENEPDYASINL